LKLKTNIAALSPQRTCGGKVVAILTVTIEIFASIN